MRSAADSSPARRAALGYCERVPGMDLYKCRQCVFMHRFPSKVRRHFLYRHAPAFPYRCGHCEFRAVESGKVKRHCAVVHAASELRVLKVAQSDSDDTVVMTAAAPSDVEDEGGNDDWLWEKIERREDGCFKCPLCAFTQLSSSNVKRHYIARHLHFHPYACRYCDYTAVQLNKVRLHSERMHHGQPAAIVKRRCPRDAPQAASSAAETAADTPQDTQQGDTRTTGNATDASEKSVTSPARHSKEKGFICDESSSEFGEHPSGKQQEREELAEEDAPSTDDLTELIDAQPNTESSDRDVLLATELHERNTVSDKELAEQSVVCDNRLSEPAPQSDGPELVTVKCEPADDGADCGRRLPPAPTRMRFYKCVYCDFCTEASMTVIRTHIMTQHLKRCRYWCPLCGFERMRRDHVYYHQKTAHPGQLPLRVHCDPGFIHNIVHLENHGDVQLIGVITGDNVPIVELTHSIVIDGRAVGEPRRPNSSVQAKKTTDTARTGRKDDHKTDDEGLVEQNIGQQENEQKRGQESNRQKGQLKDKPVGQKKKDKQKEKDKEHQLDEQKEKAKEKETKKAEQQKDDQKSVEHDSITVLFQCPQCDHQFRSRQKMRFHQRTHIEYRPYGCDYCAYQARNKMHVHKHCRSFHPDNLPRFRNIAAPETRLADKNALQMAAAMTLVAGRQTRNSLSTSLLACGENSDGSEASGGGEVAKKPAATKAKGSPKSATLVSGKRSNKPMGPASKRLKMTCTAASQATSLYKCSECGECVCGRSRMYEHLIQELDYKPYACGHCSRRTSLLTQMKKHAQLAHRGRPFKMSKVPDEAVEAQLETLLQKSAEPPSGTSLNSPSE